MRAVEKEPNLHLSYQHLESSRQTDQSRNKSEPVTCRDVGWLGGCTVGIWEDRGDGWGDVEKHFSDLKNTNYI